MPQPATTTFSGNHELSHCASRAKIERTASRERTAMALFGCNSALWKPMTPIGPSIVLMFALCAFFYYILEYWQHNPPPEYPLEVEAAIFTFIVYVVMCCRDYLASRRLARQSRSAPASR